MKIKIDIKRLYAILCLIVLFIVVFFVTIGRQNSVNHSFLLYITFAINGLLWTCLLLREIGKHSFSLIMIFWFFCLFFFFFAGLIQTVNNKFPWIDTYSDDQLLITNCLLLLWTIMFQIGVLSSEKVYFSFGRFHSKSYKDDNDRYNVIADSDYMLKVLIVITVLTVLITVYRVRSIGLINLLARGTSAHAASNNASLSLLINKTQIAIVYFAVAISIYRYQINRKIGCLLVNGLCLLISYFPTSVARNAAAGLYIGLLLIFFPKMKRTSAFSLFYTAVFMLVFPLFNAFRSTSILNVNIIDAISTVINRFSREWLAVDYDAYSMVSLSIRYIGERGISFGRQMLGVIFFWIPRSLWHEKPGGTGPMIAEYYNWWFTNVSEPLPAEMIVNFGIIGMVIAAFVCGLALSKFDNVYWIKKDIYDDLPGKYDSLYFYMIGYFLFVYRGALLSAVAYLIPFIVVWYIVMCRPLRKLF